MYNRFFTVKTWEVKIALVLRPLEILPAISYPELRHIPVKLKNSSGVTTPFFGPGEVESEIYLHLYCSRVRGCGLRVWNLPYPSCVNDISKKKVFFVLKEAPQRPWTSWITGTVFKIYDHTFQIHSIRSVSRFGDTPATGLPAHSSSRLRAETNQN